MVTKLLLPVLFAASGALGVFAFEWFFPQHHVDADQIRAIVSEELQKLPKPEPAQAVNFDKIKGRGNKIDVHQHFNISGDSLMLNTFSKIVEQKLEEKLKEVNVVRCKR